jgi:hypothetical protein
MVEASKLPFSGVELNAERVPECAPINLGSPEE